MPQNPEDLVSELLGGAPAGPAPQGAPAGAPGSGLLAGAGAPASNPQGPPVQQVPVPPAAQQTTAPETVRRIDLSQTPAEILTAFEEENGRRPTPSEVAAVRAAAMLTQQLGRPPSRREIFGHLYGRTETPQPAAPQFTLDV